MVGFDAFEALDERLKAVRHEHELAFCSVVGRLASQSGDVLETCACPVVYNVHRKDSSTDRIKPPDIDLMTDQREEQRERIEVNVRLAVLCQSLDLRRLDPCAAEPDSTFDDNGSYHGEDSSGWKSSNVVLAAREKLFDRLLQNLEEGDDHDDREDKNAKRFEASTTNWKLFLESS